MLYRTDPKGNRLPPRIYWHGGYEVKVTRQPKCHYVGFFRTLSEAEAALAAWLENNPRLRPRFNGNGHFGGRRREI